MNSDKRAEREQHRAWLRECIARCRAEVARYEKAVERRPNTYRPRLAEAQHTLGKFYWWRHTPASYRTALRLFTQALCNYDSYRGRRDLTLNRLTLMSDLQQLSLRLDDDRAEEVLLGLLSAYESMAAAAPLGRTRSMTGSERWRRPASVTDAGRRWFSAETGLSLRSRAISYP